jgi:CDP-diacylglycerol---glycerol-3-phosphate 3-phosphatidyltransferase
MLSALVGNLVRGQLQRLGHYLAMTRLTPNAFTLIGLLLNVVVAAIIASGNLVLGGIMALVAGAFDMLDGAVARSTGQVTKFGGFFDSTLDRYSESIVYFGVLIYLMNADASTTAVAVLLAAVIGSLMVSYTRARAEATGVDAEVGIFARPERVILLAILLIFEQPVIALWILAVVTNFTTMQRIFHVWRETRNGSD